MMGPKQEAQAALFYEFSLEDHVPQDHLLRSIDRFVDLSGIRAHLSDFYSHTGRPSIDPELLIRMLLVGYCSGIRSERRLCEEVHLNLAYRWFCRLDLTDRIPDHSSFSKNRHGRFRESDLLRHVFETTVARCMEEGLVGGQGFAVDASLISADVQKQNSSNPDDWAARMTDPDDAPRAVREYLDTLDDEAFGAATTTKPKFTAHADPASQWTAARKGPAFFAYSTNYLIDTDHSIIVDVDASRSNRTAEVGAMRKMIDRTEECFGLKPDWIAADTAYGSSDNLVWLTTKRKILPFIPVFDKGERTDGKYSRSDFTWDDENDRYICPGGKEMKHTRRTYSDPARNAPEWKARKYRALKSDCTDCPLKAKCCPKTEARAIHREKYEIVREFARQCTASDFNQTAQNRRKKVEMLFAHLKRILGMTALGLGDGGFLFVMVILFLILGMFLDALAILVMAASILYPVASKMGFDPIWFAVIVVKLMELGVITPPVGINLFTVVGASNGDLKLTTLYKGIMPLFLIELVVLFLLIKYPLISTWLPSAM